jgi:hypothetical protein
MVKRGPRKAKKGPIALLKSYTKEIFTAKCNPSFQSVHGIAHLQEDIGEVLFEKPF